MPKTSFSEFYTEIKNKGLSGKKQGTIFEQKLCEIFLSYFKISAKYETLFEDVWLWRDFPYGDNQQDLGIDLVAKVKDCEDFWSIQCKFYDKDSIVKLQDISTFFTASYNQFV